MKLWPLLALLLLQTAPNSPELPRRRGTVEGVVTRLGTSQPVADGYSGTGEMNREMP